MSDSRDINDLHPKMLELCKHHQAKCTVNGIPFTVTFTYRSFDTQAKLYAQGRTAHGKIVTNAKPGQSFHNYGLAYDGVPNCLLKLPDWGDTPDHQHETDRVWALYGHLATECGMRWGGDFKSLKGGDRPHCEYPISLHDLQQGKRP